MTETAVCVHCKKSVTRETVWIDDDEDIYSSIICAGREDGVGHEPSPAVPAQPIDLSYKKLGYVRDVDGELFLPTGTQPIPETYSDSVDGCGGKEILKRLTGAYIVAFSECFPFDWQVALDKFVAGIQAQRHVAQLASDRYEQILTLERKAIEGAGELACAEATIAELELKYRKLMWLSHGHLGIYGDDGEMQCSACIRYGCPDYKRQPIKDVEFAYELARQERRATGKEPR